MSDLTRRVLDADTRLTREDGTIPSDQWDDAVMELLDAAPVLARQVEAVETVIGGWEDIANEDAAAGNTIAAEQTRNILDDIRDALTEAAKETPND